MSSSATHTLIVDAGHTRIKFALCEHPANEPLPLVREHVAPMAEGAIPWDEIITWTTDLTAPPQTLITGSSPKSIEQVLGQWPKGLNAARKLVDRTQLPIIIEVDAPERVGIDRLLTAIAANKLRAERQTAIVVDSGTAITVDAIGSSGIFHGGAILPGVRMGSQALHRYTATLPEIDASTL
ncbi:MAG: type III pantothenate kinase, partial [Planctomycetaceae bacterium]|nr:type III pantothenate kinase [Planctomycetaceae bacterium]